MAPEEQKQRIVELEATKTTMQQRIAELEVKILLRAQESKPNMYLPSKLASQIAKKHGYWNRYQV